MGKKKVEEVQEYKYLDFIFNRKGNYVDHIKEICRKGKIMAKKAWGGKNMVGMILSENRCYLGV